MTDSHLKYFKNFWKEYQILKNKYELCLFKRKFYIDGLKLCSKGTYDEIKWLNTSINNINKTHNKLVADINNIISNFKTYLKDNNIDWDNKKYKKDYLNALHGIKNEIEYENIYQCSFTRHELANFEYPNSL